MVNENVLESDFEPLCDGTTRRRSLADLRLLEGKFQYLTFEKKKKKNEQATSMQSVRKMFYLVTPQHLIKTFLGRFFKKHMKSTWIQKYIPKNLSHIYIYILQLYILKVFSLLSTL